MNCFQKGQNVPHQCESMKFQPLMVQPIFGSNIYELIHHSSKVFIPFTRNLIANEADSNWKFKYNFVTLNKVKFILFRFLFTSLILKTAGNSSIKKSTSNARQKLSSTICYHTSTEPQQRPQKRFVNRKGLTGNQQPRE